LQITFEDQVKTLIFFYLEEYTSAQRLFQVFEEDDFERKVIAPEQGIKKAKVHLGFDLNHPIAKKIFLRDSKGAESPFVNMILSSGQIGVLD